MKIETIKEIIWKEIFKFQKELKEIDNRSINNINQHFGGSLAKERIKKKQWRKGTTKYVYLNDGLKSLKRILSKLQKIEESEKN